MMYMYDDDVGIQLFYGGKYIFDIDMDNINDGVYKVKVTWDKSTRVDYIEGRNLSMYAASGKMVLMTDDEIAKHMLVKT